MIRLAPSVLGLILVVLSSAAWSAEDTVRAQIVLQSGQAWEVELMGRFRTDRILLKRAGESGAIELMVSDIGRIDFPVGSGAGALLDQYNAGEFAQVAPRLDGLLQPYAPYIMDASSNLDILFRTLAKAWYWAGHDDRALATCAQILSGATRGELYTETSAIQILSQVRQGRLDPASETAETLAPPSVSQPEAAAYGYALATLQLAQRDLTAAQESLARLICFRSRDPEWMPPALLLSAEAYARAGQPEVAHEIIDEIVLNYPATPSAAQAKQMDLNALEPWPRK